MCIDCYKTYGSPAIVTDRTKTAAQAIAEVYKWHLAGGNLHIAIDDWNIDDGNLQWLEEEWLPEHGPETDPGQLAVEEKCLTLLKELTLDERASALALHDGFIT